MRALGLAVTDYIVWYITFKQEILNYTCQDLIRVVPFFASASEAFVTSIITRVSFDVFLPGDYVTRCGAIGTKMFFIQHGVLEVVNRDGKVATTLCDGSYFGGISSQTLAIFIISLYVCTYVL